MKKYKIVIVTLFTILTLLGVLFYLLPNKPTVSEEENRTLATRPDLSAQTILDGSFMSDYSTYFSDNFPFREQLIKLANQIKKYKGTVSEDNVQIFYVDNTDETTPADETTEDINTAPSQSNDPEALIPETEEPSPEVALDDGFFKNGLIICGDTGLSMVYQNADVITAYAQLINNFADQYPDVNVHCGVIPIASAFYLPEKFCKESNNQEKLIQNIYDLLDSDVNTIDIYSNLKKHADEYIYLRTDHHWTGLGAFYAYEAFIKDIGQTPTPISCFPTITYEGFLGTLYNKVGGNRAMWENPDTLIAYVIPYNYEARYWNDKNGNSYRVLPLVAPKLSNANKYMAFTYGDHGVINIDTSLQNGRKIMVFKDSFANAFVPFLVRHFQEIYVIDPRYPVPSTKQVIEEEGITDVLYLTNMTNTSVYRRIKELKRVSEK